MSSFNGATAKQLWKQEMGGRRHSALSSFNGATAKQLWKRTQRKSGAQPSWRFNGATAKQLWKPHRGEVDAVLIRGQLQWGHSQTAVETRFLSGHGASHLPLQWGHSQTAVETGTRVLDLDIGTHASMGPQPNSCGNLFLFSRVF